MRMQVIAVIGVGFMVLSLLLIVSLKTIGIIALIIIASLNLLHLQAPSSSPFVNVLRNLFFTPGVQVVSKDFMFLFAYPLIPLISIMLLGFSCGRIFEKETSIRNKTLLFTVIVALTLFVLLRLLNVYGDPAPWKTEKNGLYTFLSFMNVTKYPPSLIFTLLFLGIAFVLLRFAEKLPGPLRKIFTTYGS